MYIIFENGYLFSTSCKILDDYQETISKVKSLISNSFNLESRIVIPRRSYLDLLYCLDKKDIYLPLELKMMIWKYVI